MKPVKRMSVSNQVFEQLRDTIIQGKWTPGTKIPSENELTRMLGVSRITIREALQKLATLGLVETKQGEGTYVKALSAGIYMNSLIPLFLLDKTETLQVLEYRKIIEVGTAGLAAERANQDDIAKLQKIMDNMKKVKDDVEQFAAKDLEFHLALAEITKNSVIIKVNNIIKDILSVSMSDIVRTLGNSDGLYYHKKIIDAIKRKDKELAEQLMEEHLIKTIVRLSE
ncbi:MAG: GntR family transcriptional regulator, transcriptional repressor for pyruvate dehydrogenase complex [Clostridiales bacterium]|nr:GntR family transcriptional regulator, transcriptional repressor for pyruvate dehydrogenase complex [Clostridiales bacterium]